jgi:lysophospholipid acyltransferase (LPLAT)-like uncharacterized protein
MFKRLLRSNFFITFASGLAAGYLYFVRLTSRIIIEPDGIYDRAAKDWPVIFTLWHGQLFLGPVVPYPKNTRTKFLVSRHRDGEFIARIAQSCGLGVIRGSGSPQRQVRAKGGASSFREMMRTLENGTSIGITADVPKIGFKVGPGVAALARASGRTIYPMAIVSSRHLVIDNSWDKTLLPLPFGRIALVVGKCINVPEQNDDIALESARQEIEAELEKATARACLLTGKIYKAAR